MAYTLSFEQMFQYDDTKPGIMVPVSLSFGGKVVSFDAAADTGASACIFERVHGERLGFDIERGLRRRFGTATGSFTAYSHEVLLSTVNFDFDSVVFFAESEFFDRNVLGREGWLRRFKFGLDDYASQLYLGRLQ